MRSVYFALKFFYENVLNEKFEERLPVTRKENKLPLVLSREEIKIMIDVTENIKHRLVLMFLYYAGLRLSELINLKWWDILHPKLKEALEGWIKIMDLYLNQIYAKNTVQKPFRK